MEPAAQEVDKHFEDFAAAIDDEVRRLNGAPGKNLSFHFPFPLLSLLCVFIFLFFLF